MFNPTQFMVRTAAATAVGGCDERVVFSQEYGLTLRLARLGAFLRLDAPVAWLPREAPGRLSTNDLQLLYSFTDLFVFPSLYEGFGMPVLEAMACGATVLTSNSTALAEVAGDAAVLADPQDTRALGEAMIRVLEDESLRSALKVRGFARARQFSWENAAVKTIALYKELCAQKP